MHGRGQESSPKLKPKLPLPTAASPCSHCLFFFPPFFFSSFVVLPGTKKPQLFSDQNVFHNRPSGAFPLKTGRSPHARRAISLLIAVAVQVSKVS